MSNSITATITPDLALRSNVTIDSRDNKIIASVASLGDFSTIVQEVLNSIDLSEVTQIVLDGIDLGNVDNTSDLDKPISIATQAALDLKADLTDTLWFTLARGFTGTPTQIATVTVPSNGVVYQYDYVNGTRYRFIADDNSSDQFYETFTSNVLAGLVAEKQITL